MSASAIKVFWIMCSNYLLNRDILMYLHILFRNVTSYRTVGRSFLGHISECQMFCHLHFIVKFYLPTAECKQTDLYDMWFLLQALPQGMVIMHIWSKALLINNCITIWYNKFKSNLTQMHVITNMKHILDSIRKSRFEILQTREGITYMRRN